LDKSKPRQLIDGMKRNTDSHFYLSLTEYLQTRLYEIQELLCRTDDTHDIYRLQGRANELEDFLKALTRKPVTEQHTGSFN
jgi:hypothetical protein